MHDTRATTDTNLFPSSAISRSATALIFSLAIALTTAIFPAVAQGQSETEAPSPGDWALQFQVQSNFTLGAFQGSVLSVKHQISERRALRLGTGFRLLSESDDTASDVERDRNLQQVQIDAQYLFTSDREDSVRPYAGAGPTVSFQRVKQERPDEQFERTDRSFQGGLAGVFGVEWMVRSGIGISAEYGVAATYRRTSSDRETTDGELNTTSTAWNLGARPVLFGVSVYF